LSSCLRGWHEASSERETDELPVHEIPHRHPQRQFFGAFLDWAAMLYARPWRRAMRKCGDSALTLRKTAVDSGRGVGIGSRGGAPMRASFQENSGRIE
jgi:hypothetical protein